MQNKSAQARKDLESKVSERLLQKVFQKNKYWQGVQELEVKSFISKSKATGRQLEKSCLQNGSFGQTCQRENTWCWDIILRKVFAVFISLRH